MPNIYYSILLVLVLLANCRSTENIVDIRYELNSIEQSILLVLKRDDFILQANGEFSLNEMRIKEIQKAYMKIPLDPWGNEYMILISGEYIAVCSRGLDNTINTSDDHFRLIKIPEQGKGSVRNGAKLR